MKWKKILMDPSFWILLIANVFIVYKYEQNPKIFTTLIWLFWSQNILYGFFNFIDILTSKNVDVSDYRTSSGTTKTDKQIKNIFGWGFLFHFGFFHLAYFIFLISMPRSGPFDWSFYKYYLVVFFVFQVINFIQHKIQNRTKAAKIGSMFGIPYLRVIPMHLCILIPAFLNVTSLTVFLVLKVIADVVMYLVTNSNYQKNNTLGEITTLNIYSATTPE